MLVRKTASASESLLDSDSAEWGKVQSKRVRMSPTPLDRQPNDYVKLAGDSWDYGSTTQVWVKSVHNGKDIFFLLEWEDATLEEGLDDSFPDAAGLLFPLKKDAPIDTMGSKEEPVNAWFWRADRKEGGRNITAEGLGSTQETPNSRTKSRILTRARWKDGRWRVLMSRALTVDDTAVQFEEGGTYKMGFALWQGSNQERAGLKSFSNSWLDLVLEES